jgi:uncharacterized membrane protein YfcA
MVSIVLFIANLGGLGGGGSVIPLAAAFFKFGIRNAIPLSNTSVFFAGFLIYIGNLKRMHPLKEWSVIIDHDIATLMLPMAIVGASIGVAINGIFPQVIILSILTFTLVAIQTSIILKLIHICI